MVSIKQMVLASVLTLAIAPAGNAAVISYDLNTILGHTLTPSPSYGIVQYKDGANVNTVDVTITLNGSGQKIQEFIFNYNDAKFSSSTPFVITGDVSTFKIIENGVQADGYSAGKFDIQTPSHGKIGLQPITFNIALAGVDLNPDDFAFKDSSGKLFNAVHVGNCGVTSCPPAGGTGTASIWVGSGDPGTPVPEPVSMVLLGLGLVGTGIAARRRR